MTPDRILQVIGDKPVSACLLRARFPKIESDARAERILAGMVESGDLVRCWRGGRTFYRKPSELPPSPISRRAETTRHYRPRGYFGGVIVDALRRNGRMTALELAAAMVGEAALVDPVEKHKIYQRVMTHMRQMMRAGAAERTGRKPHRYSLTGDVA